MEETLLSESTIDIINSYNDDSSRAHRISEILSSVPFDKKSAYIDLINKSRNEAVL